MCSVFWEQLRRMATSYNAPAYRSGQVVCSSCASIIRSTPVSQMSRTNSGTRVSTEAATLGERGQQYFQSNHRPTMVLHKAWDGPCFGTQVSGVQVAQVRQGGVKVFLALCDPPLHLRSRALEAWLMLVVGGRWRPLVQSDDGCTVHPHPGCNSEGWDRLDIHSIQKEASEIRVWGHRLLPSAAQPSVLHPHSPRSSSATSTRRRSTGSGTSSGMSTAGASGSTSSASSLTSRCGGDRQYHPRPLPNTVFAQVQPLVQEYRWNSAAAKLCEPRWQAPIEIGDS